MTTLISGGNHDEQRRCDAKCHDATTPECDCICGGRNHGVGRHRAIENTREMAKELLARAGVELDISIVQEGLFQSEK